MNNQKTAWQILNDLDASGELSKMVMAGFCNPKVMDDLEIVRRVDAKRQIGVKNNRSVEETAEEFKVCRQTVYNAISIMKQAGSTMK